MAEDLVDGEFWLPSHFLTDDDILLDFKDTPSSGSDLDPFGSITETESDEDDLTHYMNNSYSSLHSSSKIWGLSNSPQSTLCGCGCSKDGSSHDVSPNPPVSPPPPPTRSGGGATLDLLHKAADEVARYKMNTERPKTTACGTGFFDCSANIKIYEKDNNNDISSKRLFCPPPPLPYFSRPQFAQFSQRMMPQFNNGKQLLGLGPNGWPPHGAHNRQVHVRPSVFVGPIGPKRESVGTGVFLPRRVSTPADTRTKKPEGNSMKMKSGKGSSQPQRKRISKPPTSNNLIEIQLPQEWSY